MADDLSRAVNLVRNGQMDRSQREALAALLLICGNATLPTPVIAAVFNVVEVCKHASWGDEQAPEQNKQ